MDDATGTASTLDRPFGSAGRCTLGTGALRDGGGSARVARESGTGEGADDSGDVLTGGVATPAGRLQVDDACALVDGAEAVRRHGDALLLGGVPALLDREPPRPGAWRRPAPLHVRGPGGGRLLLEAGPQHELHPSGRGEGTPLVTVRPDGGLLHLSWSRAATPRDLALAVLLVLEPPR